MTPRISGLVNLRTTLVWYVLPGTGVQWDKGAKFPTRYPLQLTVGEESPPLFPRFTLMELSSIYQNAMPLSFRNYSRTGKPLALRSTCCSWISFRAIHSSRDGVAICRLSAIRGVHRIWRHYLAKVATSFSQFFVCVDRTLWILVWRSLGNLNFSNYLFAISFAR